MSSLKSVACISFTFRKAPEGFNVFEQVVNEKLTVKEMLY